MFFPSSGEGEKDEFCVDNTPRDKLTKQTQPDLFNHLRADTEDFNEEKGNDC